MKKIITALANPELSQKIKKENDIEIIIPDIQYQEGVIEILEKNKNAEILILNSLIYGKLNIYDFINKIREINNEINIIIILENKNIELENFLNAKRIYDILYNSKNTINELIEKINKKNNKDKLKEINIEINKLKETIIKNNNKNKQNKTKKNQVICITGNNGVRKKYYLFINCKKYKK